MEQGEEQQGEKHWNALLEVTEDLGLQAQHTWTRHILQAAPSALRKQLLVPQHEVLLLDLALMQAEHRLSADAAQRRNPYTGRPSPGCASSLEFWLKEAEKLMRSPSGGAEELYPQKADCGYLGGVPRLPWPKQTSEVEALCQGIGRIKLAGIDALSSQKQVFTPVNTHRKPRVNQLKPVHRAKPMVGIQKESRLPVRALEISPDVEPSVGDTETTELTKAHKKNVGTQGSDLLLDRGSRDTAKKLSPEYSVDENVNCRAPKKINGRRNVIVRTNGRRSQPTNSTKERVKTCVELNSSEERSTSFLKSLLTVKPHASFETPARLTPVSCCSRKGKLLKELEEESSSDNSCLEARKVAKDLGRHKGANSTKISRPGKSSGSSLSVLHEIQNSPVMTTPASTASRSSSSLLTKSSKTKLVKTSTPAVVVKKKEEKTKAPISCLFKTALSDLEMANESIYDFVPSSPDVTPRVKRGRHKSSTWKKLALSRKKPGIVASECEAIENMREECENSSKFDVFDVDECAQCDDEKPREMSEDEQAEEEEEETDTRNKRGTKSAKQKQSQTIVAEASEYVKKTERNVDAKLKQDGDAEETEGQTSEPRDTRQGRKGKSQSKTDVEQVSEKQPSSRKRKSKSESVAEEAAVQVSTRGGGRKRRGKAQAQDADPGSAAVETVAPRGGRSTLAAGRLRITRATTAATEDSRGCDRSVLRFFNFTPCWAQLSLLFLLFRCVFAWG